MIKLLLNSIKAKLVRYFRGREIIRVLGVSHARELAITPGEQWPIVRQKQLAEIQAVKDGKWDIIDRRSWGYPYIPECVPEDTEILTKRGWVSVSQINKNDEFATRSSDGFLQYQKATKLVKYKYNGDVLYFKNKVVDIRVTPEHRFYGRYRRLGYSLISSVHTKEYRRKSSYLDNLVWALASERARNFSEVSTLGFSSASEVESFLLSYKNLDYGFDVPATVHWKGKFPVNYNRITRKIKLKCLHKKEPGQWSRNRGTLEVDLKDWVAFLGIFVAEGMAGGTGLGSERDGCRPYYVQAMAAQAEGKVKKFPTGNYTVQISQQKSSKYYEEIRALLQRLPWNFVAGAKGGFATGHVTLHSHVCSLGNTYTKYIPGWIKDLPPEYLDVFLTWACKGDGWFDGYGNSRRRNYKTVSKVLAQDIEELFRRVGKDTVVKKDTRQGNHKLGRFNNAPQYIVSERHSEYKGLPRPVREHYGGFVYCVSVPNQVICLRRTEGRMAVWTGNSLHRL